MNNYDFQFKEHFPHPPTRTQAHTARLIAFSFEFSNTEFDFSLSGPLENFGRRM